MNRVLIFIILFLFVVSTVLVCVLKPKTHKPIAFESRNFEISMISDKAEVETPKIEITQPEVSFDFNLPEIKPVEIPPKTVQQPKVQKTENKTVQPKKQDTKPKTVTTTKPEKQKEDTPQVKKEEPKTETPAKPQVQTPVEVPKPVVTEKPKVKVLTEQEEIIAWNKWRSDLQNKLMKDSKISAPIGTSFMFSFTVDKNGNISNLKTWSSNPSYTPLAVSILKPLLLSYQHTYILNFPEGSQRIITNADGGFTMSRSTRYSSPSDYNDYERVSK